MILISGFDITLYLIDSTYFFTVARRSKVPGWVVTILFFLAIVVCQAF